MRNRTFGLTLVEVLVCVAIVAILSAVLLDALMRGRRSGDLPVEIEQMHQLSIAGGLYHEQNNDSWPDNTKVLVDLKMAPAEICKSPRDRYARGQANEYLSALGKIGGSYADKVAPFPNTYLSIGDVWMNRREEMNRVLSEEEAPGLFVSLVDSRSRFENSNPSGPFWGRYRRVLLDGAVVVRYHTVYHGRDEHAKPMTASSDSALFFDPSERWVAAFWREMGGDSVVPGSADFSRHPENARTAGAD